MLTSFVAATMIALVSAGAVLIWTRPSGSEFGSAAATQRNVLGSSASDTGSSAVEVSDAIANSSESGESAVAASLRQFKAFHEEGILTDDEYETNAGHWPTDSESCDPSLVEMLCVGPYVLAYAPRMTPGRC